MTERAAADEIVRAIATFIEQDVRLSRLTQFDQVHEGIALAARMLSEFHGRYTLTGCEAAKPVIEAAFAAVTLPAGGSGSYTCEFCGGASPKSAWGPGWVTCPSCGKQARSVSERATGFVALAPGETVTTTLLEQLSELLDVVHYSANESHSPETGRERLGDDPPPTPPEDHPLAKKDS